MKIVLTDWCRLPFLSFFFLSGGGDISKQGDGSGTFALQHASVLWSCVEEAQSKLKGKV